MNEPAAEQVESPEPTAVGFALWLAGCLVASAVLIAVSHWAQQYSAPLLLFPLLVGVALGSCTAYLSRVFGLEFRRPAAVCLTIVALALTVGQHAVAYRDYRDKLERSRRERPERLLYEQMQGHAEPTTFGEYLSIEASRGRAIGSSRLFGWQVWASWAVDAAATVGGALVAHRMLARKPIERS